MIESKINLIKSLTVRFKEVSNLTNSIRTLDFESIVNERLHLKNELQRHIDDLFNAFKEIWVITLELDLKDLVPSEEETNDLHWKLWLEAFNTLENMKITRDQNIQVEENDEENQCANSN